MAELLAALGAIGFGSAAVMARLGLRDTNVGAGAIIGNAVAVLVLIPPAWLDRPASIAAPTMWFVAAGVFGGAGLASVAMLLGLRLLGPPTHVPLQGGSYGASVSIGAVLALGETVGVLKAVGIAAIVVGGGTLVRTYARAEAAEPAPGPDERPPRPSLAWVLPLAAGVLLATGDLIIKANLDAVPHPTFAAAAALSGGLFFWFAVVLAIPAVRRTFRVTRRGGLWFVGVGAATGASFAAVVGALSRGEASTVGPILACEPLAAIVLSALFLSRLHTVTKGMALAGAVVVAGAVLVSL